MRKRMTMSWLGVAAVVGLATTLAAVPDGFAQDPKAPPKVPVAGKSPTQPTGLKVVQAWARATPGGAKVGAAFLEIQGAPDGDDKLLAASTPIAGAVELHDHIKDGGIMRMRRIEAIPVPAGKTVTLKPGGLHLMLLELKAPLVAGDAFDLTLTFEKSGTIKVTAPVQKIGAMTGPEAGSGPGSDHGSGPGMKH